MLGEQDLLNRITKTVNLKQNCFKYLEESSKDLLAQRILYAIATLVEEKGEPIRLSEIALYLNKTDDKLQQDNIRLTIEKTLLKCGLVEKLRYSIRDVRYIPTGYRFQKIQDIDSFRGDRVDSIGDVFELPKISWPIPDEYFTLKIIKKSIESSLKKLNSDFDQGFVPRGKYETIVLDLNNKLEQTVSKIQTKYNKLDLLLEK